MIGFVLIFMAKVVEVTLTTLRMLYLGKGAKVQASLIGFVEVLIWIKIASIVLVGIEDNPVRMFVYALGFAAGSYVGIMIEEKIGMGYSHIEIITNREDGSRLAESVRELGKAVTILNANGRDGDRIILKIYVRRKIKDEILNLARELNIDGVITVSETQKTYGGFGLK